MPETPLDPAYKGHAGKQFYLSEIAITGRRRVRTENIPNDGIDFPELDEQGRLEVTISPDVLRVLVSIDQRLEAIQQALLQVR